MHYRSTDRPTDGLTNQPTDQPTNQRTDTPSYRDAWTHLKRWNDYDGLIVWERGKINRRPKRSHDKLPVSLYFCLPLSVYLLLSLSVYHAVCICLYVPLIGLFIRIVQIIKLKEEDDRLSLCLSLFLSVYLTRYLFVSLSV